MSTTLTAVAAPVITLQLSADRKVSTLSRWKEGAKRWEPQISNTLGLPPIVTCPERTAACSGEFSSRLPKAGESTKGAPCYAAAIPWPTVHKLLQRNLDALEHAETEHGMTELLDTAVAGYRRQHDKYAPNEPKDFRIHWSGDYYRVDYSRAWRRVILANPDVNFWSYTRTFAGWNLSTLAGIPNHSLYLSADDDNATAATRAAEQYNLPIATMSLTKPKPAARGHAITCPVDIGNKPLVEPDGQGACINCKLCPQGQRDIYFPTR